MDGARERVHATCIALGGRAVLIRGPSGSGKSDLALRCLAMAPNALIGQSAQLVSDDQVEIENLGGTLIARAPKPLRGLIEVRGQGIVPVPAVESAEVVLIADIISETETVERLPDPVPAVKVCGTNLPVIRLHAFEPSAAIKVLMALACRYGEETMRDGL